MGTGSPLLFTMSFFLSSNFSCFQRNDHNDRAITTPSTFLQPGMVARMSVATVESYAVVTTEEYARELAERRAREQDEKERDPSGLNFTGF